MPHNLQITEEAHRDALNAVSYYLAVSERLADRFEQELYLTYSKISSQPLYYKYLTKGKKKVFRCARLRSFPFLVIYRIEGNLIVVVAVFNTHRSPVYGLP
jgi:mRNA-degrading endonuclease RelE of RelBE toxin-antitoxin system